MGSKSLRALVAVILIAAMGTFVAPSATAGTKTKTFTSSTGISIPNGGAGTPYPSQIAVSGFRKGRILDVNVTLQGFAHGFADDVDVLLLGPTGRQVVLLSDIGGGTTPPVNLVLDDAAAEFLPDGAAPTSGTYKPTDEQPVTEFPGSPSPQPFLGEFNSTNPNGLWSLYALDDFSSPDGGSIASWSLRIKARVK